MTLRVWEAENKKLSKACNHDVLIRQLQELYGKSLCGQVAEAMKYYKELKAKQENGNKLNKLSYRRRCKSTPTLAELRAREKTFVNDAIITEKKRTKYKDIIPVYDASRDSHCHGYFMRPDVKRLINLTCSNARIENKLKDSRKLNVRKTVS